MPVIPTYDAKAGLDPDQAPHPQFDTSAETAAAGLGRAVQSFGSSVSELGAHLEQRQQEKDSFNAQIGLQQLQQTIKAGDLEAQQQIAPDGSGWAVGRLTAAREASSAFLGTITNPKLREEYAGRLAVLHSGLHNEYAQQQLGQQNGYFKQHISDMATNAGNAVLNDPAQLDAQTEQLKQLVSTAGSIPILERQQILQKLQGDLQMAYVYSLSRSDPIAAQAALGVVPRPGSPGAVPASIFQRMVGVESSGNPTAISPKGAAGLAQLMPDTARQVGMSMGLDVAMKSDQEMRALLVSDPALNIRIGQTYFNQLLQRYGDDQEAAVVAYNAGPGRADDWLRKGKDDDVLPHETIAYKAKVLGAASNLKQGPDSEEPDVDQNAARVGKTVPPTNLGPGSGLIPYLAKGKDISAVTNLNSVFAARIQTALAEAPPAVQQGTTIASGFRSNARQAEIYAAAVQKYGSEEAARKWAAPPGHSNHNAGQAMDLSFKNDVARQWWHANADRFGLKFPLGNEDWHIEPKETRGGGTPLASTGMPFQDVTTADPRLSAISFEKRLALSNDIARNQRAMLVQQNAQATADHNDFMNSMQLAIHDGKAGLTDIAQARYDGKLSDYDDIHKLESQVAARDQGVSNLGSFDQALAQPGFSWNPLNKDHRDMADAGYAALSHLEGPAAAAQHIVERTGILPSDAGVALRGALVQDPAKAQDALQAGSRLLQGNPNVFAGMKDGSDFADKVASFNHYVKDLGFDAQSAAQKIYEAQQPEHQQSVKAQLNGVDESKILKDARATAVGDIASAFKTGPLWFGKPDVGFTPLVQSQAVGDYVELLQMNLEKNGDVDQSKALAIDQMKRIWGVSNVTKSGVLTRYPVDRAPVYAGIDDAAGRIADQIVGHIKDVTGQDVDRKNLSLASVSGPSGDTAAAYKDVRPVPVSVGWTDDHGLLHTLPAPFAPDPVKMRDRQTADRQRAFQAQRDQGQQLREQGVIATGPM